MDSQALLLKQNYILTNCVLHPTRTTSNEMEAWYDNCRKADHTRDNYLEIHGKSANLKTTKSTIDKESKENHVFINESVSTKESCPCSKE